MNPVSTDYANVKAEGPPSVLDEIVEREDRRRLRHALEKLPQPYREVLWAFAGKLSVRFLAKKWGVSTQRVYQIKKKAERLLQQALS